MSRTIAIYPAYSFSLRVFATIRSELKGHKQRDVAAAMGITEQSLSRMMRGGENLKLDTLTKLLMAAERLNGD